ncbi:MAG: hypothetical protein ACRD1H_07270 [Vicinamibacterales bacterium]
MTEDPASENVQPIGAPDEAPDTSRTARDALYEQIGLALVKAGVISPASQFVADVRQQVGFRASPREVVVAVEQIAAAGGPVTVESVAKMVASLRGGRSTRQQRHTDAWRTLGAQLELRGLDGSPEGQRSFIGIAHAIAGKRATDSLLLRIALALVANDQRLDAELVGRVGKRLAHSAADIPADALPALVEREIRALVRDERRPKKGKRPIKAKRVVATGSRSQIHNPGARKWRPGGRRRRKIQFPPEKKREPFER